MALAGSGFEVGFVSQMVPLVDNIVAGGLPGVERLAVGFVVEDFGGVDLVAWVSTVEAGEGVCYRGTVGSDVAEEGLFPVGGTYSEHVTGCEDSGRAHLRCSRLNVHVCGLVPLGFQVVASSSIRWYMACASNVPELAVTHSSTMPRVASFHRWSSASSSNTLVIPAAVFFSAAVALALS